MNLLFSYAYIKADEAVHQFIKARRHGVLMDSGAFSVFTTGAEIKLSTYSDACKELDPYLDGYIQLDVVRNPSETERNLEAMVSAGLRPWPVFVLDAPLSQLGSLVALAHGGGLCVAGGVTEPTKPYVRRIQECWEAAPNLRLHGLGFTRGGIVTRTRVSTVDSSTWTVGAQYGNVTTCDPVAGTMKQHHVQTWRGKPLMQIPRRLLELIVETGCPLNVLEGRRGHAHLVCPVSVLNMVSWMEYAEYCRRRGVKVYFACTGLGQVAGFAAIMRCMTGRRSINWNKLLPVHEEFTALATKDPAGFAHAVESAELTKKGAAL